jgi:small subunit ribosomal protein S9
MAEERREDESIEQPGESPADEPAGREGEVQPEEVQGEETVVEDEATRERSDSQGDTGEDEAPRARAKGPSEGAGDGESGAEAVPGAELEPIAIEPERELSAEERARIEAEAEERARREAEATAEEGEEPAVRPAAKVELPPDSQIQATGKRKSSIARVVIRPGEGRFEINDRALDEYFPRPYLRSVARQALVTTGYEDAVDVRVRVHGGGVSGQAGAVRHGVARALCEVDPELRGELKRRGLLTRDARTKERRKAGLKKARKRPQFSKR